MNLIITGIILEAIGAFMGMMKYMEIQHSWYVRDSDYTTLVMWILLIAVGGAIQFFGYTKSKNEKLMDIAKTQNGVNTDGIVCPNCGLSLKKGVDTCPKCGTKL